MKRTLYYVYFRKFYSDTRYGGYFYTLTEGTRTVTKARDAYVNSLRSSASTPKVNDQARATCAVLYEEITIGELS